MHILGQFHKNLKWVEGAEKKNPLTSIKTCATKSLRTI